MPPNFHSLVTLYFMSLSLLQAHTEQQTSPSSANPRTSPLSASYPRLMSAIHQASPYPVTQLDPNTKDNLIGETAQ